MRPVGSVFLLRAAPDVVQQFNPSMTVSATIVVFKLSVCKFHNFNNYNVEEYKTFWSLGKRVMSSN